MSGSGVDGKEADRSKADVMAAAAREAAIQELRAKNAAAKALAEELGIKVRQCGKEGGMLVQALTHALAIQARLSIVCLRLLLLVYGRQKQMEPITNSMK